MYRRVWNEARLKVTPAMDLPLRLLLVIDSSKDAELTIIGLRCNGLDVAWERVDTETALKASLAAGTWQVVLSDHIMRQYGSAAALVVVRAADPDMPFIVVSGTVDEEAAVAIMRAGANDYIPRGAAARLPLIIERVIREADIRRSKMAAERKALHLAAVVDFSSDAIISKSPNGSIVSWNAAAEKLLGWSASEAIGRNISLIVPPNKIGEFDGLMDRLRRGEHIQQFETTRMHRNGMLLNVSIEVAPILDRDGQIVGMSKIARDIGERLQAEKAIRASETRYRRLFEAARDGILILDVASRKILDSNPYMTDLLGYARSELVGKELWEIGLFQDIDANKAAFQTLQEKGFIRYEDLPLANKHGHLIAVEFVSNVYKVVDDLVIQCNIRDITERKKTKETVRASEERFRVFMDNSPATAFIKDAEGRFLYVNPTWQHQFSPEKFDWQGKTEHDFWPQATADLFRSSDLKCLSQNITVQSEESARMPDGTMRTWLVMKFPLVVEGRRCVGGNAWEITDRKRAEDSLRLRDRAIQAVTQGIVITDPLQYDNPIIYAGAGVERITGYGHEEIIGRNCRFLQGRETDAAAVAELREAIHAGEPCTVELLNYRKDGTPFWNAMSVAPVRDESGQVTEFVGIQTDVTARRNLEAQFRQAQKMDAFGQLAGGVAHDFNNLLTIINGYSDLLLQSLPTDDPSRQLIAEIYEAGQRSAALTRQLLAFSRQQILAPRILYLNEVVIETDKMLRRIIGEDVRLTTTLDSSLWMVQADPGQIEQVLLNLSVNARDAMPKGGRLTIETRNIELDDTYVRTHLHARIGPHVVLSLTDTGTGMSSDVQSRIFEPFFTTKGLGKGTGLGLATVFGIVKQSGGHVAVYSEVGLGTSFKVYLPKVEERSAVLNAPDRILTPPRGTETVLLAEDEQGVRSLIRAVLLGCGYKVLEAADGDEAMRMADERQEPIHLLITDVVMPGTGGRALSEQVSQRHPEVRVLYISGYTDDAVIRHGVLREGVHFLQKPFSPASLAIKVREILDY